jgi:tetratricopeptide (TPR) repeat protein
MHQYPAAMSGRWRRQAALSTCFLIVGLALAADGAAQPPSAEAAARLLDAGSNAEAKVMLLDLARRHPRDAHIALLAGRAHVQLGEADDAVRQLERAIRLEPDQPLSHFWLARAYALQLARANPLRQRPIAERMRRSLERVIELDPTNVPARLDLVQFHLRAPAIVGGDPARAHSYAAEITAQNRYVGAIVLQGLHAAANDTANAERVMRELVAEYPDSVAPRVVLAQLYQRQERFDEAWAVLQPLAEMDNPPTGILYLIGRQSAVTGRDLDRGEKALREYLRRTPGEREPPPAAAHTRLGEILRHRGDLAGARREYEAALRIDPQFQLAIDALRQLR